jgi:hypothetical protein
MTIIRFVRGKDTLDLTQAPFEVGLDFVPPAARWTANITSGTGSNPYGGGVKVSQVASDRELSFSVLVKAESAEAVTAGVRRLQAFLSDDTGLWFEYAPLDLPVPSWGQIGAPERYEVVHAQTPTISGEYGSRALREQFARVGIRLTVKPLALGARQRLAQALGAVWEEHTGMGEGQVRGLRIAGGGSNKMTNPVFAAASWNNGWAAGANIVEIQNTDPAHCFPGSPASAHLVARANTGRTYTQSIDVGSTATHYFTAYVARADGEPVTVADCFLYYGGDLTTAYAAMGSGIYRLTASATGVAAATATGLVVPVGHGVYLLGYSCDTAARPPSVHHGDMLGGAWAGTEHESATTRTAGRVKTPLDGENFNLGAGAVHLVWKPDQASTAGSNRYLFACGGSSLRGYYNATNDTFVLTDHTNTATSAAQTFSAEDVLDLLFVWGPVGLAIYKNGAAIATEAAYTPPALPTELYWLTDAGGTNHADGVLMGAEIYGTDPSAAEAAAIYSATAALVAGGARAGSVPLLWTKDGDNVVDNRDDATYDNWCVILGVPGDATALFQALLVNASGFDEIWLSSFASRVHYPNRYFWYNVTGGASTSSGHTFTLNDFDHLFAGKSMTGFCYAYGAGITTGVFTLTYALGSGSFEAGLTSYGMGRTNEATLPQPLDIGMLYGPDYLSITAAISYDSAVTTDWVMLLTEPILHIEETAIPGVPYIGKNVYLSGDTVAATATGFNLAPSGYQGRMIQIEPNAVNMIHAILIEEHPDHFYKGPTSTLAVTISPAFITPRWSLL